VAYLRRTRSSRVSSYNRVGSSGIVGVVNSQRNMKNVQKQTSPRIWNFKYLSFARQNNCFRFIEGAPTSARQSVRELMKLDASHLQLAPNGMSSTKRRSTKRSNQSTKPKFVCPILNFHFRIASCKTKLPKNHVGLRRILVARLNLCGRTCSAPNQPMFRPIGCDIL